MIEVFFFSEMFGVVVWWRYPLIQIDCGVLAGLEKRVDINRWRSKPPLREH